MGNKHSKSESVKFYRIPCEIAQRPDLPPATKLLLGAIADRLGQNGFCWPSIRRLANDTGLTKQTILSGVGRLKAKGLLEFESGGQGRANHYWLTEVGQKLYHLPDRSGPKIVPVTKSKRSKNYTTGVPKIRLKLGQKLGSNHTKEPVSLNQTHISCPNSEALRLAELLLDLILTRKPDFRRPNLQTWAKHIERMIRLDRRTPERIEQVVRLVQDDPFWQNNILSTAKLRERFDQLELKMRDSHGQAKPKYDRDFAGQTSSIGSAVEM